MRKAIVLTLFLLTAAFPQSGGQFQITRSAISNGGGTSEGGTFSLTGTIGQATAGTASNGSPYGHSSGFWNVFLAPTAAPASVSGRVVTASGRPISRASVVLDDGTGSPRTALTTSFGHFNFEGIESGRAYILSVAHRRYQFAPQVLNVSESVQGIVITAVQ